MNVATKVDTSGASANNSALNSALNEEASGASLLEQSWLALMRHKVLIAIVAISAIILGLVITLLMQPMFTATSRIEISREEDNVTNVEGVESSETGQSLEFYQTQYALLNTNSLAIRVARELNLANDDAFLTAFDIDLSADASMGEAPAAAANRAQRLVVQELQDNIAINPIRGSSLVDVGFTSPNPSLSAKVANAWTEQFIQSNLDRRFSSTNEARDFLQNQLVELRERLEESERDLVNYASNRRIITLSRTEGAGGTTERTLAASDLEALNNELADAEGRRIQAQSALRTSRSTQAGALANPAINGLRQERALIQAELAKLMTQFESGYPAVVALQSQIDELARQIGREEARVGDTLQTGYAQAVGRERELRGRVEQLKQQVISEREQSVQYNIRQRDVDTNRELYDGLLQRFKEIGVAGIGSNNVAIVDRAEPPEDPSNPNLLINLAISILFGGLLAGGLVFALEQIDRTVRDPEDVVRLLGAPLLGAIPRSEEDPLLALEDPKSPVSEAYISVKTGLSLLTDHGIPRSVVLTSTGPNEGKSISSYALARFIARGGSSVLLIDADMRNPSLRSLIDLPMKEGLANYLSGDDNVDALIQESPIANLKVMNSGPIPPSAAELLSGNRIRVLLANLQEKFDHILIDSPPILGLADAPLLTTSVEGVIIVVEANKHRQKQIQSAAKRLSNAHILGSIVTKLDKRNDAYGYGYGYGYGHAYGDRKEAQARFAD